MGTFLSMKTFFCDLFGIETKEEKLAIEKSSKPSQKPTSDEEKKKKEHKWADVNDPVKYICQGGKVQCLFCSFPKADILVTSSTIMLQDKPWATVADKDGKVNFNFTGVCTHPSHGSNKPPCKAVISLGDWKDISNTYIGNNNALLMKSTIPCMISGQDLKIIHSGQKTSLSDVKPKIENPKESIVSIDLLRGDTVQTETVVQYVNIGQNANFVDGTDITHIDSLGQKLRLIVKFDRPGVFQFKVKLTPDPSNVTYSASERNRNPNFEYTKDEIEFTTNSNGEKVIDADKIFVSPAGGDIFTISAKDNAGNEVFAAGKIKTQRMMYYVEAKMAGLTTMAIDLTTFTDEYDKHNITFKGLPSLNIAYMHNIGNRADSETFKNHIQTAYAASTAPTKTPYCTIIGYTDHLAVKDVNQKIPLVNVTGGAATSITIPVVNTLGKKYVLWKDIVPGEDWFVECYFIKAGGTLANKVNIAKEKCTPIQNTLHAVEYCDSVSVDISSLPAEAGTITLKVNWVNRMRGGLSFGGTNIVAICTKAWWKSIDNTRQNQTIIHEMGHQLGMVADGGGKLPDKTSYFYDNTKGHIGEHCHYDIAAGQDRYDSDMDRINSKCVMYGATNWKSDFCPECAKALKKVDLIAGV